MKVTSKSILLYNKYLYYTNICLTIEKDYIGTYKRGFIHHLRAIQKKKDFDMTNCLIKFIYIYNI